MEIKYATNMYRALSVNKKSNILCGFLDEFRSKVACENERIQLKCNPNSRVAVYSASYGRTEYESIQCPQPQGVPEESKLITSFSFTNKPNLQNIFVTAFKYVQYCETALQFFTRLVGCGPSG